MISKKINLGNLIFILFYQNNGVISGLTRLQKLIDIIRQEGEFIVESDYSPYDYGDFSQNVADVLQVFMDNDWIIEEKIPFQENKVKKVLKLTEDGNKIGKELYENLLSNEIKYFYTIDKFIKMEREDLISYSYFWYPSTAIKSKIKSKIFKKKKISDSLDGILEDEYELIKSSSKSIKDLIRETWKY
ncbi:MAG: hypothetical protein ACFFAN_05940 [Promethearchaeota archaeon]